MDFNILNLVFVMFLTGAGSFGGGIGAVNILKEFILKNDWLSYAMLPSASYAEINEELASRLFRLTAVTQYSGYSQGIVMSSYLGAKFGVIGVILSVLAFILPSVIIVILIFKIGEKLYKNATFKYSLKYINLLAAGLTGIVVYNFVIYVFGLEPVFFTLLAAFAGWANIFLNINPVLILLAGGIIGAIMRV
jgi:chromate transporter